MKDAVAQRMLPQERLAPPADRPGWESDDTLILLFMCCQPSLSPASQIALTLRGVGGLTTAEVARALLVPRVDHDPAHHPGQAGDQGQRRCLHYALKPGACRTAPGGFPRALPDLQRGYVSTSGPSLDRADLTPEAIRLTRMAHGLLPTMARWPASSPSCCSPTLAGPCAPGRWAHPLEMAGDRMAARDSYLAAARRATNLTQQRYLHSRAARLTNDR